MAIVIAVLIETMNNEFQECGQRRSEDVTEIKACM